MGARITSGELARIQSVGEQMAVPGVRGKGRPRHEPEQMNRLEARYAQFLEMQRQQGNILWWRFEAMKVRLAKRTWYNIDFLVMMKDHALEVREVKGYWEDDARVKIKVAAEAFPLKFLAVTWDAKMELWHHEVVGGDDGGQG